MKSCFCLHDTLIVSYAVTFSLTIVVKETIMRLGIVFPEICPLEQNFSRKWYQAMKIKTDYILRKVGKQYVVVATGRSSKDFHGMIRLNESAAFVFDLLKTDKTEPELIDALIAEYSVDETEARNDISAFLDTLKEAGALE